MMTKTKTGYKKRREQVVAAQNAIIQPVDPTTIVPGEPVLPENFEKVADLDAAIAYQLALEKRFLDGLQSDLLKKSVLTPKQKKARAASKRARAARKIQRQRK